MRLPAPQSIAAQNNYPSQSEGGFTGDLHASLLKALKAWEAKRFPEGQGFRYGKTGFFRPSPKQSATRDEISWNPAPEVKRESRRQKERQKRAGETAEEKAARLEKRRQANVAQMRRRRESESPEAKAARLEQRRAVYKAKMGDRFVGAKVKLTPEQRLEARKAAKQRWLAKVKAGQIIKKPYKRTQLTEAQLKRKAERQRRYYAEFKQQLAAQRAA